MDSDPIFAALNCFLVCYYLPRLCPATTSNETALSQQSNERAEKAFNCSPIAYRSRLFTDGKMYSLVVHASVVANGNPHRNVIYINL